MTVRHTSAFFIILAASLFLVACSTAPLEQPAALAAPESQQQTSASSTPSAPIAEAEGQVNPESSFWAEQVARLDEQGAVVVEITPLNLNSPGETLDFQISLNTHSVDLSMDLAALSTLKTDTGYSVQATAWEAPLGGHHVSGKLSFPATVNGASLLADATKLTLTMLNLDAPERKFVWEK